MAFGTHYTDINQQLDLTCELLSILQGDDDFPAQFFFDVRPALKRVKVEGLFLEEQELFDLRRSLETINDIVKFLKAEGAEEEGFEPPISSTLKVCVPRKKRILPRRPLFANR